MRPRIVAWRSNNRERLSVLVPTSLVFSFLGPLLFIAPHTCPPMECSFWAFVALAFFLRACGLLRQDEEDEEVTLTALWDGATYIGQTRSLLHNIAALYPAVGPCYNTV